MTNPDKPFSQILYESLPSIVKDSGVPEDDVIRTLVATFSQLQPIHFADFLTTDEYSKLFDIYQDYVANCKDSQPFTIDEFCYYLYIRGCLYD